MICSGPEVDCTLRMGSRMMPVELMPATHRHVHHPAHVGQGKGERVGRSGSISTARWVGRYARVDRGKSHVKVNSPKSDADQVIVQNESPSAVLRKDGDVGAMLDVSDASYTFELSVTPVPMHGAVAAIVTK